jgi:hypothetical protein
MPQKLKIAEVADLQIVNHASTRPCALACRGSFPATYLDDEVAARRAGQNLSLSYELPSYC